MNAPSGDDPAGAARTAAAVDGAASSSPHLRQQEEPSRDGGGGGRGGDLCASLVPEPRDSVLRGLHPESPGGSCAGRGGDGALRRPPSAAAAAAARRRMLSSRLVRILPPAAAMAAAASLFWLALLTGERPLLIGPEARGVRTVALSLSENRTVAVNLTAVQAARVERYRSGTGLMLFLHVTHHGGTFFCGVLRKAKGFRSPGFACRIDRNVGELDANLTSDPRFFSRVPWHANETRGMIDLIRPHYDMISFEFGFARPAFPVRETDWDSPDLLSVFVSRHPLDRMLAGDGYANGHFNIRDRNATAEDWWAFANTTHGDTDNFMLRVLSSDPRGCCRGAGTPRERLDEAVELLDRFTFVLDIRCLNEGVEALAGVLGIDLGSSLQAHSRLAHPHPEELSTRFPYREVYEFLLERNRLDIELYEWTQRRALVNCDDLPS